MNTATTVKFETKIKLSGGHFAAFYTIIKASESYYRSLANSGNDLSRKATEILYWRVIIGLKKRLEIISAKKQDQFLTHINFLFSDVETCTLINAILPPLNNSYNDTVIYAVRSACFQTAVNMVSNFTVGPAYKQLPQNANTEKPKPESIDIVTAQNRIDTAQSLRIGYNITSYIAGQSGRELVTYKDLSQALEDGSRLEPITLSIDEISVQTISEL